MDFLFSQSIIVYFIIFFGKLIEVAVTVVRIVLINRGERVKGTFIAFIESALWLSVTGIVIEVDPEAIMDSLSIGMYGFERFNMNRDLKPSEYKIYQIIVTENNPVLYLYKLLSEVLQNQGINLEQVLRKATWKD